MTAPTSPRPTPPPPRESRHSVSKTRLAYIIAIDFDGTLCQDRWPEIGPAKEHNIELALKAQAAGAKLILNTCRVDERLRAAVDWCTAHGLHFDAICENLPEIIAAYGGDCRKICADEYWDDKAVTMR